MMAGYLASKGVHASQQRVGAALCVVQPPSHEARSQVSFHMNVLFVLNLAFNQKAFIFIYT